MYRADLMEKRVKKLEESVHYLVAGVSVDKKPGNRVQVIVCIRYEVQFVRNRFVSVTRVSLSTNT